MAVKESYAGKINRKLNKKLHVIDVAAGRRKADLVLKNATYVNVFSNELCHADIAVAEGLIVGMGEYSGNVEVDVSGKIVLPGFVDAHIHLESSLVSPSEFARAVLPHGTTTVITDPHEIANVMGTDGIEYMLQATEDLPVDVRFMLPSCVPATPMDESGANLDYRAIDSFYDHPRVQGLAEMMNSYGVIHNDPEVVSKIVASQAHHKKIDGHAPGLQGKDLDTYVAAGVYSDHECHDLNDAIAKLQRGQFIMIREGTAARNLEALAPLLCDKYSERCMFCTDDKHPSDLLEKGHIDYIMKKAIALGADAVYIATAALLALGCHLCRTCQTGKCNWGIATQNPDLVKRLNPEIGKERLVNLMTAWKHEIKELMGGMGINSIEALKGNRLMLRGIGLNEKELEILGVAHAGE